MYPYYYDAVYRQNEKLRRDIQRAINGEYTAIQCYARLINLAPTAQSRTRITEIRRDEMRHFRQFSQIYKSLTGTDPQPKMSEECPNTYREGLEAAFIDEQETVDFYLDIAEEAADPVIKDVFRRAAADEQNHAVWFMYFMHKERR